MARRRPQSGGKPRRSTPYAGSVRQNPVRRPSRRRSALSRMSTRSATLLILGTALAAIAGVAVAGAITSNGGVTPTAANTPSTPPVSTPSASPSGPLGPVAPTPVSTHSSPPAVHTPSPAPVATPKVTPKVTPSAAPSATPSATKSGCPTASGRVAAARKLLQHTSALPNATLITSGPRQGLLGASDLSARTVTLFVRSCANEPTIQLAFVWGYEAGQFIPTQTWSSSTSARWAQLRGIHGTPSQTLLRQDAASVYAFWQTGTTRYWQSPIAPPSASQLQSLVPYLKTS
jgi:hypothetical protein